MYILLDIDKFDKNNIIFGEKTRNTIIDNSDFYNIHYTNSIVSLNNIMFSVNLNNVSIEKYYNKYKCTCNNTILNKLINIEYLIMSCFPSIKMPNYRLKEQLDKNNIKLFHNKQINENFIENMNLTLKISGIWENDTEYGIIYKFTYLE